MRGDVQHAAEAGGNQSSQTVVHARGGFITKATNIVAKKPAPRAAKPSAAPRPAPSRRVKFAAGRTPDISIGNPDSGTMPPEFPPELLKL